MVSSRRASRRQRELGQNFLVDRNVLGVIERLAQVGPDDVVLEIGAGLGVLSVRLAARARHLHVVEVDPGLEPRLREALAAHEGGAHESGAPESGTPASAAHDKAAPDSAAPDNVTIHIADALELDLAALTPAPNLVVANLPYAIAATAILRTIEQLPGVARWVVMVQREVGERLAASAGEPAYGATSVLAQLATEVKILRAISRNVFRPVPNVDSVLLGLERRGQAAPDAVRTLVREAFAHRRKAVASSLALASGAPPGIRERTRSALIELGHPPDERAERLSPGEFLRLAALLEER